MYRVYKISFEDGCAYVGQTQYPVEDRIRRHINRPDNQELSHRLITEAYVAEVLYENIPTFEVASQIESDEIFALEKPINISGVNPDAKVKHFGNKISKSNARRKPKRQRQMEPRAGEYRCSKCGTRKPHTEFYKDRTRFNGLHSRCKSCNQELASTSEYLERSRLRGIAYRQTEQYKAWQRQRQADIIASGTPAYLKHLRVQSGLGQAELAKMLNISQQLLSGMERGTHALTETTKQAYEKALGLNMDIAAFLQQGESDD